MGFARVCDCCSTNNALKLIIVISEKIGLPNSIKVDNAKAYRSNAFEKELSSRGILLKFGTPYVHTPGAQSKDTIELYKIT